MHSCCVVPPLYAVYMSHGWTGLGSLWSLMEYKCMVSDRVGELIWLLSSLWSPSSGGA